MADANGRAYSDDLYPGKTDVAHVNHYQCRSFLSWMRRVERGDVSFDRSDVPPEHAWRLDEHLCLRQFVETVAKDKNELVDEYMRRFESPILEFLASAQCRDGLPLASAKSKAPEALSGHRWGRQSAIARRLDNLVHGRLGRRLFPHRDRA
jgi:hypothetical protein